MKAFDFILINNIWKLRGVDYVLLQIYIYIYISLINPRLQAATIVRAQAATNQVGPALPSNLNSIAPESDSQLPDWRPSSRPPPAVKVPIFPGDSAAAMADSFFTSQPPDSPPTPSPDPHRQLNREFFFLKIKFRPTLSFN